MIRLIRTTSENKDFIALVKHLDADLILRDGDEHAFHAQFNKIDHIKHVIVAYLDDIPVGCGSIKYYDRHTAEIKRMYVSPQCRGRGVATTILTALEDWAHELCYTHCILETGVKYPEAIALYQKNGYKLTPNYGQYATIKSSRCFKKELN